VELHLADQAELHFSGEVTDYLPAVFCRSEGLEMYSLGAYIYAYKQDNIALTGNGTLFGPDDGPSRKSVLKQTSDKIVDQNSPVSSRVYDGIADPIYFRPYSVSPVECTNVFIEGVKIIHGAFWNVVPVYCDKVIVRGVTIESVGVDNGDGVNIESSKNVLVEYCSVRTGDDSFCLKAGRDLDGLRVNRPVENVVERFNLSRGGHGGITCGSETAGGIRNLYVYSCRYEGVRYGIRFKTRRPRAGGGQNLIFENIYASTKQVFLSWEMLGETQWVGDLAYRLPKLALTPLTPDYHDITIRSVVGISEEWILKAQGIPESPLRNVVIENSDLSAPNGIKMTDAHDITIRNCDIRFDSDVLFDLRNVQHFQTPLCRVEDGVKKTVRVAEETCEDIDLSRLKVSSLVVEALEGARKDCVVLP
jgi:pectate lyase